MVECRNHEGVLPSWMGVVTSWENWDGWDEIFDGEDQFCVVARVLLILVGGVKVKRVTRENFICKDSCSWQVNDVEPVSDSLLFEVQESWIINIVQGVVTKYFYQWLMVNQ